MTRPQGVCANFALAACAQTTYSQPIMALRKKSIFETRAERITAYFHTLLKESDRGCVHFYSPETSRTPWQERSGTEQDPSGSILTGTGPSPP